MNNEQIKCDLCGDEGVMHLHSKCHLTAPLSAEYEKESGILTLRCYVPECRRIVAEIKVEKLL